MKLWPDLHDPVVINNRIANGRMSQRAALEVGDNESAEAAVELYDSLLDQILAQRATAPAP